MNRKLTKIELQQRINNLERQNADDQYTDRINQYKKALSEIPPTKTIIVAPDDPASNASAIMAFNSDNRFKIKQ